MLIVLNVFFKMLMSSPPPPPPPPPPPNQRIRGAPRSLGGASKNGKQAGKSYNFFRFEHTLLIGTQEYTR